MDWVKAALVGLFGGVLAAASVFAVEMIHAERQLKAATTCADFQCFGSVQVASIWGLLMVFVLGFAAAFAWFLRAHRRPVQ